MPESGDVDQTKGRIKEAAGDLTNNQDLKNDGKVDKASGSMKNVVDKAKEALHRNH